MGPSQRIFISYSRVDAKRAREVYDRLKQSGFAPWIDVLNLRPGESIERTTRAALDEADVYLVLLSEAAVRSRGVLDEIAAAVTRHANHGTPLIVPIRLHPVPIPAPIADLYALTLDEPDSWNRLIEAIRHADTPSLVGPTPPDALVQACLGGTCVLYAGSGLSAPSGFPTWPPMVSKLLEWARERSLIEPGILSSLSSLAAAGDLNTVADEIVAIVRSANASQQLDAFLQGLFVLSPPPLNAYHEQLRGIPFSAVLTTNFDNLLEATFPQASVLTPSDTESLLDHLVKRQSFVLKLYGTFGGPDPMLVAPAQYTDTIASNTAFAQFVESLFVSRTLFFVGCSLDGIQAYLEGLKIRKSNRQHYALVGVSGRAWEAKAQLLSRRYGIHVIPYPLSDDHAEVATFLGELARQAGVQAESPALVPTPESVRREVPRLKRMRLNGIGLFDSFEIEFKPGWNILLGNNGVGKSTILKALAVGLCGRDAQPFVQRMLKRGASTGSIVLETTDGTEYVTEIMRTSGAAEIVVRPARPLDTEGWLCLGFPPLRLLSWNRPSGPILQESRSRPESDDLLPIISGGLDPRLDQLKQWIVTLDYLIKDERSRGKGGERSMRLLQEFFAVIGKLTGDLRIEFHSVDASTREVLVQTDDGVVPIESVSQGMASLLGWVGVLMQRLYTVFDQEEHPTQQHAIVLIDEVDAHMHPEWQQGLVPLLSGAFEQVQFIATTHSPLIVAGMDVCRITKLERDEDGRVVCGEVPEDMTMGRADQVLTGTLFGLSTTLDVKTQGLIGEYQVLLGKRSREPEEEARFRELERVLEFRVPVPTEQPAERRAQELLEALLRHQLGDDFQMARQDLLERARRLLREADSAR